MSVRLNNALIMSFAGLRHRWKWWEERVMGLGRAEILPNNSMSDLIAAVLSLA